jgi:hypothetical protein
VAPSLFQAAINRFIAETNDKPKPFVWTKSADAIPRRCPARETSVRSDPLALSGHGTGLRR